MLCSMRQANTFGQILTVTSFGESRGAAVGVIIDGCPAGFELSEADFNQNLAKRRSQYFFETPRKESDQARILSGIFEGRTLGTPIAVIVENKVQSEKNYETMRRVFRPGHADAAWQAKFGIRDHRGGGRSSGRETVARVLAATVAQKILAPFKISCRAIPAEIAGLPCNADGSFTEEILNCMRKFREAGNSCGGIVRIEIKGVPAGLGEPVFSKLDAELAKALISVGAVKAVEFGAGFNFATMDGFHANELTHNYNGGIIGGISTGETIFLRLAIKPVPSIALEQICLDEDGNKRTISIQGEHDCCLVRRICPVLEAMCELVLADFLLLAKTNKV